MRPLDLRALIRRRSLKSIGFGLVGSVAGLVVLVLGLLTGFLICVGLPLFFGGLFMAGSGVVSFLFPEGRLSHLGGPQQRRLAIADIEAESRTPQAYAQPTSNGHLYVLPTWLVLVADKTLVVERRRDVLWVWVQVRNRRYGSAEHSLKLRTRRQARDHEVPGKPEQVAWLAEAVARACPHAFAGYDPRVAQMPMPALVAETERRAWPVDQVGMHRSAS